jgi:hypothetical protein
MGTVNTCDGCGEVCDKTQQAGIIKKMDYCEECFDVAIEFVSERNQLHEEVGAHWDAGMAALKEGVEDRRPGMRLPDG